LKRKKKVKQGEVGKKSKHLLEERGRTGGETNPVRLAARPLR